MGNGLRVERLFLPAKLEASKRERHNFFKREGLGKAVRVGGANEKRKIRGREMLGDGLDGKI